MMFPKQWLVKPKSKTCRTSKHVEWAVTPGNLNNGCSKPFWAPFFWVALQAALVEKSFHGMSSLLHLQRWQGWWLPWWLRPSSFWKNSMSPKMPTNTQKYPSGRMFDPTLQKRGEESNISCPQGSVAGHLLWNKAFKDHDIHFHTVVRVPSRSGLPAKQALLGMLVIHKFSWKSSVVFSSPLKDMENKLSLFWNSAPSPWSKTGMHLFFQFGFVSNLWSFHLGPLRSTLFQNSANFFVPKKPWKSKVPSSSMLRWCIQRQGNFNGICLTSTAVALLSFTLQVTGKEAGTNDCGIFFIKSLWQFWWCLPKVPKAAKSCTSLLGQPDSLAACAIFLECGRRNFTLSPQSKQGMCQRTPLLPFFGSNAWINFF